MEQKIIRTVRKSGDVMVVTVPPNKGFKVGDPVEIKKA